MISMTVCNDSNNLIIDGGPDAVRAISLEGNLAKRLADLSMHLHDLTEAEDYLRAAQAIASNTVIYRALGQSAVVTFMKCFAQSKARSSLDRKILNGTDGGALPSFQFFYDLRNKHIAHDENPFSICSTFALINDGKKPYKVEKVCAVPMKIHVLEQSKLDELAGLIETAKAWLDKQIAVVREKIIDELDRESYQELASRNAPHLVTPHLSDVGKNRARANQIT